LTFLLKGSRILGKSKEYEDKSRCKNMSKTYQPKKKKRQKTHGFLKRSNSPGGKKVILKRRRKGRKKITV